MENIQKEEIDKDIVIYNEKTEKVIYLGEFESKLFQLLVGKTYNEALECIINIYGNENIIKSDFLEFCNTLMEEGIIWDDV